MKISRPKFFGLSLLLIIIGTFIAILITNQPKAKAGAQSCAKIGQDHQVVIINNQVSPEGTYANICDSLTIINKDKTTREIGFGAHDHHQPYGGIYQKTLKQGQKFTMTLSSAGLYHFHDHFDEVAAGYFNVE